MERSLVGHLAYLVRFQARERPCHIRKAEYTRRMTPEVILLPSHIANTQTIPISIQKSIRMYQISALVNIHSCCSGIFKEFWGWGLNTRYGKDGSVQVLQILEGKHYLLNPIGRHFSRCFVSSPEGSRLCVTDKRQEVSTSGSYFLLNTLL